MSESFVNGESVLVSVVVPIYNAAPFLRRCIESVLEQTLLRLELILVDDGSSDDSRAICDEYALLDARVRVAHQGNSGAQAAVILGVSMSVGEYVGFVDADDWVHPRMFESLHSSAMAYDADLIQCGFVRVSEGRQVRIPGCLYEAPTVVDKADFARLLLTFWRHSSPWVVPSRWNKLFRRGELLRIIPSLDAKVRYGEDLQMVLLSVVGATRIVAVPDCLYYYRVVQGSVTNSYSPLYGESNARMHDVMADLVDPGAAWLCPSVRSYLHYLSLQELGNELRLRRDPVRRERLRELRHVASEHRYVDLLNFRGLSGSEALLQLSLFPFGRFLFPPAVFLCDARRWFRSSGFGPWRSHL